MLTRLLHDEPELIRARSARRHHSTLLHYVGANGVEAFRQHTPQNAVAIAEVLLDAGAEVDTVADMYGGSTALGLVATSLHPKAAGVQRPLIQLLLDRGVALGHSAAAGGRSLVHSCLANGRPEAAAYLASRGAPLDFESAAGVGRLDVVQSFFSDEGAAKPSVTKGQMESALMSASVYGRTAVAEFLLARGLARTAKPVRWDIARGRLMGSEQPRARGRLRACRRDATRCRRPRRPRRRAMVEAAACSVAGSARAHPRIASSTRRSVVAGENSPREGSG